MKHATPRLPPWFDTPRVGPARGVAPQKMGIADYHISGPERFEQSERETGIAIERTPARIGEQPGSGLGARSGGDERP